jgi:hypothetical protein
VSRVWRKVKADWEAWNARSLAEEPIVRLILDGTVVRVRLDRKATSISLLVVISVREDGQKVLLALKNMGGESTEAWRAVLDDLVDRGLHRPAFLIVDGTHGLGFDPSLELLVQTLDRVRGPCAAPLGRWQASESEEAVASFLQAVRDGAMTKPPLADESVAARRDLLGRGRVVMSV